MSDDGENYPTDSSSEENESENGDIIVSPIEEDEEDWDNDDSTMQPPLVHHGFKDVEKKKAKALQLKQTKMSSLQQQPTPNVSGSSLHTSTNTSRLKNSTNIEDYIRINLGNNNVIGTNLMDTVSKRLEEAVTLHKANQGKSFPISDLTELLKQVEMKWSTYASGPDGSTVKNEKQLMDNLKRQYPCVGQSGIITSQAEEIKLIEAQYKKALRDVNTIKVLFEWHELLQQSSYSQEYRERIAILQHVTKLTYEAKKKIWEALAIVDRKNQVSLIDGALCDIDADIKNPKTHALVKLHSWVLIQCRDHCYAKKGNMIYKEVIDDKTGKRKHAFEPYKLISDFVYDLMKREENAEMFNLFQISNQDRLINNLTRLTSPELPLLDTDKLMWAFPNCLWDAKTDTFIPHSHPPLKYAHKYIPFNITLPDGFDENKPFNREELGKHYWKKKYPEGYTIYRDITERIVYDTRLPPDENVWKEEPTWKCANDIKVPLLHKFMVEQKWSLAVQLWVMGLIFGRLPFGLSDGLEFCGIFFGKAGCGKTSMAEHMSQMFHNEEIFKLESNGEKLFGLEGAIDCSFWMLGELKHDIQIPIAFILQMIEGTDITIPRKNKEALKYKWRACGLICGNDTFPIDDSKGAMKRRLLPAFFEHKIDATDARLKTKLLPPTLPDCIRKCTLLYRTVIIPYINGRGLWTKGLLPDYFHRTSQAMSSLIDKVSDYVCEKYVIIPENKYSELENLITRGKHLIPLKEFMNTLKQNPDMKNIKQDQVLSSLERLGIDIFELNPNIQQSLSTDDNVPYEGYEHDLIAAGTQGQPAKTGFAAISSTIQSITFGTDVYDSGFILGGIISKTHLKENKFSTWTKKSDLLDTKSENMNVDNEEEFETDERKTIESDNDDDVIVEPILPPVSKRGKKKSKVK